LYRSAGRAGPDAANKRRAQQDGTGLVVMSALVKAYTHVIVGCVVVVVTVSALDQSRAVLPWVAALVALAIVARVTWSRTNY
jgi:hypothetical protein